MTTPRGMTPRRPLQHQPPPGRSATYRHNNTVLERGRALRVRGIPGDCTFYEHVLTDTAEWITVQDRDGRFRSVTPGKLGTVRRKENGS